jgi:hypothetical protein
MKKNSSYRVLQAEGCQITENTGIKDIVVKKVTPAK